MAKLTYLNRAWLGFSSFMGWVAQYFKSWLFSSSQAIKTAGDVKSSTDTKPCPPEERGSSRLAPTMTVRQSPPTYGSLSSMTRSGVGTPEAKPAAREHKQPAHLSESRINVLLIGGMGFDQNVLIERFTGEAVRYTNSLWDEPLKKKTVPLSSMIVSLYVMNYSDRQKYIKQMQSKGNMVVFVCDLKAGATDTLNKLREKVADMDRMAPDTAEGNYFQMCLLVNIGAEGITEGHESTVAELENFARSKKMEIKFCNCDAPNSDPVLGDIASPIVCDNAGWLYGAGLSVEFKKGMGCF